MGGLDKKDCMVLNMLQKDCRTSLTDMAKKIGLSVDSTRKRLKKLKENEIFTPSVQIAPRNLGFPNIVDIRIKLNNHSKKEIDKFINYLKEHQRVAEIFNVGGEWDFSIVVISKDAKDFGNIAAEVNSKFGDMIESWTESTTLKAYKFEEYDIVKLLGFDK